MILDARTLIAVMAFVTVISIGSLGAMHFLRFSVQGTWSFAVGGMVLAAGHTLLALRGVVPQWVSICGGNIITLYGFFFVCRGLRLMLERGEPAKWFWLIPAGETHLNFDSERFFL